MRAIIVDDEAPAREGLRIRLRREADVVVIGEFGSAAQALAALRYDPPDLLFLDIEMPGLDGFSLLQQAEPLALPAVIFVTAHDAHAVRAFDVRALDYLLKPVEQERLHEAVVRARDHFDRIRKAEIADRVRSLYGEPEPRTVVTETESRRSVSRIPIRHNGTIQFVDPAEIAWIDAAGDAVRLHVGAAVHVLKKSMGETLAMLDPRRFARIHRSTIVNLDFVRELQPYFHGEYVVVMKNGVKLKLSRGYKNELSRLLGLTAP